jgi:predicted transcriptional regulator
MTVTHESTNATVDTDPALLTDAQAAVLGALLTHSDGTAAQISADAGVSASATGKALLLLADMGLAARTVHEPVAGKRVAATWEPTSTIDAVGDSGRVEDVVADATPDDVTDFESVVELTPPPTAVAADAEGGQLSDETAVAPGIVVSATQASTSRLAAGGLRALVVEHLTAHPEEEYTPSNLSKILERSAGAISNCLDTLVGTGIAEQTCEKPRRFRCSAAVGTTPPN